MAHLLKSRNATRADGTIIRHSTYDIGHAWTVYRWDQSTDTSQKVEEIPYEGPADRKASRAMAYGCLDSLHQQALYEIHGDRYTDKHGLTLYWAGSQGGYVTVPDNE